MERKKVVDRWNNGAPARWGIFEEGLQRGLNHAIILPAGHVAVLVALAKRGMPYDLFGLEGARHADLVTDYCQSMLPAPLEDVVVEVELRARDYMKKFCEAKE